MLYLRENLFLGNINAAEEVLLGRNKEITHILSVLSSASIGVFSELKSGFSVPTKNIRTVYMSSDFGSGQDENLEGHGSDKKIHYVLENAGHDLKLVRMAIPLRDMESENLLDYLEVCLDFIDQSRKNGSVLVHCFAGLSRSASIITAYLMRTERISLKDALESLRQSNASVCPNDGFLEQLTMFEDMGFKVDHSSAIYKRFRLKNLGPGAALRSWVLAMGNSLWRKMWLALGNSYNRGEKIDGSEFAAGSGLTNQEATVMIETDTINLDEPRPKPSPDPSPDSARTDGVSG